MKTSRKKEGKKMGIHLEINADYLQSLKNLLHKDKQQKANAEFSLFFACWVSGKQRGLRTKEIQNLTEECFKKNGFNVLKRTKFFRWVQKIQDPFAEQKALLKKVLESDRKRKITRQELELAKMSKTIQKISLEENAQLAKTDIEEHFNKLGAQYRAGVKNGSRKGGQATKDKNI